MSRLMGTLLHPFTADLWYPLPDGVMSLVHEVLCENVACWHPQLFQCAVQAAHERLRPTHVHHALLHPGHLHEQGTAPGGGHARADKRWGPALVRLPPSKDKANTWPHKRGQSIYFPPHWLRGRMSTSQVVAMQHASPLTSNQGAHLYRSNCNA